MPIQDIIQKLKVNEESRAADSDAAEGVVLDSADAVVFEGFADVAPDPKPARRSQKPPKREPAQKAPAAVRREVRDSLTMMITMPAGIWAFRDPHCGGALLEHADNIAARLTPIVCRNPALLAWFTESSSYMDWFALFTALAPVAKAVWDHHVIGPRPRGEVADDAGAEYSAAAQSPAPDFSQFAAPAFSG